MNTCSLNTCSIHITAAAATHIHNMLKAEQGTALRLAVEKRGCSGLAYAPSIAHDRISTDTEISTNAGILVWVDAHAVSFCKNLEIDYVSTLGKSQLVFRNPNAKGHCGCGESFNI